MNKIAQVDIGKNFLWGGGANSQFTELNSIGKLVTLFLNIAFALAGIILLFYFVMGGIGLMSAGQGDAQKAEQAKKTLTSAAIGFVVVFASYWIVKLLGQLIGVPNLL